MFNVLLEFADRALDAMQASYLDYGTREGVPEESQYLVKRVCEDLRSALDWLATAVWKLQGSNGKRSPYFPICHSRGEFDKKMKQDFSGLKQDHPQLWRTFEMYQPYHPQFAVLSHLPELSNSNKHREFTSQERAEGPHHQLFFGGMGLLSMGADGMTIGQAQPPDVPAGDAVVSFSADGLVGSVTTPAYHWRFLEPDLPVLPTLRNLRSVVGSVLAEAEPHTP